MEGFNQNDYRMTYNVDIALCIDVTGSMRPILDTVKNNALNLCDDIKNTMIPILIFSRRHRRIFGRWSIIIW